MEKQMSFLNKRFPDIPEDGRIRTDEFLQACDTVVKFFDLLGATVFRPVKNDVSGNVAKIRKRLLEDPVKFGTLNDIVETELAETDKALKTKEQGIATNALMWLRRGLDFIALFLQHLVKQDYVTKNNDLECLRNCANMAYSESLKKYHGMIVGGIFSLAMRASPYRTVLLQNLAGRTDNEEDATTLEEVKLFLKNFEANIRHIEQLFKEKNVEKCYKV